MTRAGACTGADNLLAGGRLSLTAEPEVRGPEPIVEDVHIETAALTVQQTTPCSNEGRAASRRWTVMRSASLAQ